jgi:uncharacterized protein YprB with RNaseH-like and TPR domain/predicted nuclease with RNAse H fold
MVKSTFIFIPGIGSITESYLWKEGISTWDDLNGRVHSINLSKSKIKIIEDYLDRANKSLVEQDGSFFAERMPQSEYWRLYKEFSEKTVFLDIETTGLSLYYDNITIIGTFDGYNPKFFIKDGNLKDLPSYLREFEVIVTFNGKVFDVPFIKKEFPNIIIPPVHIDLRYLLKSFGITGSLKDVEHKISIQRPKDVQGTNGRTATVLWSNFVKGDDESLRKLLLYNICDTSHLYDIMKFCYQKKLEEIEPKMNVKRDQFLLFESIENNKVDHHIEPSYFSIPEIIIRHVNNGLIDVLLDNEKVLKIERKNIKNIDIKIENLIQKIDKKGVTPIAVGIDLTGSEKKKSGFCILQGRNAYMDLLETDEDIISKTIDSNPTIISIDSPLSLPIGRHCEDDSCECRKYGITRECERILKKRGINVYPCLIKSMQKLTMRGIKLARVFEGKGFEVIESYPGAAQDIMGLPRKRVDLKALEIDLMNMGIKPSSNKETVTHDEIDALTSALVGYFYLAGDYEAIGNIEENYLIIPDLRNGKDAGKVHKGGQ